MDILNICEGLLADIIPRIVPNPIVAAALAITCTRLNKLVTERVHFEESLQAHHRRGVIRSQYYVCYPGDYCDPSRYNDPDEAYPDDECMYNEDDLNADGNEPQGDEDFWFEHAPDYVVEFSYRRDDPRVLGVHRSAIRYIYNSSLYVFDRIEYWYLQDARDFKRAGHTDSVVFRLSGNYYAIYVSVPYRKYPPPTTTAASAPALTTTELI